MKFNDLAFRSWYYLQLGWQVYLAIIFALVNFIVVLHSFVITNNLILKNVFEDLFWFGIIIITIIFPIATILGYFHIKHGARRAEIDINYHVNPYFTRRTVNTQMILNTYLIISKLLLKTNKSEKLLTRDEISYFMREIATMKNFLQSRTMSNKLDLKYLKTEAKEN